MCQMDVTLRFWNKKKGQVETKYCDSQFLTRSNADNLYSSLETSIKGLDKAELLQLAMGEPNVIWNVQNILDHNLESENCCQHTVHRAFKDGFQ